MGDKIAVINERTYNFEGIFNLKDTYLFFKDYIENSMYYDFTETEYEESNQPPSHKLISNIECTKMLNDKYHLIIKGKITLSGKSENIEVNNTPKEMTNGNAQLILNCYVEPQDDIDPGKSPFGSFLDKVYEKFVGTDDLDQAMTQGAKDISEIISRFKQYMNSIIK